jgi:release factor glutamine methyltransferase
MKHSYKVKELLHELSSLLSPHIERASREAQLFLMYYLQEDELWLLTNQNTRVDVSVELFDWVDRRKNHEPFEYIVNKVSFYSEEFYIAPGALIPRPETELLIDKVIETVGDPKQDFTIVEVGVGSGIISIMLAKHFVNAKIIAVDISEDALKIAKKNIEKFSLEDRIDLRLGSLLDSVDEKIDYLVSNPPYIEDGIELEANLAYEPQNALFGGVIGDEIIKKLLDEVLSREIKLFSCEMGYDQKDKISSYLENSNFRDLEFYQDLSGFDRGFTLRL